MTDWEAIARAHNSGIPADELPAIVDALEALEKAFRPLLCHLSDTLEPAVILSESAVTGE